MKVQIEESWNRVLKEEFEKDYFKRLVEFIKFEYKNYHVPISRAPAVVSAAVVKETLASDA